MLHRYARRADGLAMRTLEGEAVVITLCDREVHFLNELGTAIWSYVDGRTRIDAIVDRVVGEFEVDRDRAASDVLEFLQELEAKGLIVRADAPTPRCEEEAMRR